MTVVGREILRIGELLGALSLATDLAAGLPLEASLRTSILATRIAAILSPADRHEVRYATILRHLGCTGYAHEASHLAAGDDHDFLRSYSGVDPGRRKAIVGRTLTRLAHDEPLGQRIASVARVLSRPRTGAALVEAQCAQAVALAQDLGMAAGVVTALEQIYERYDGRGGPNGIRGDALRMSTKILHLAELVEIHHRVVGREATLAEVRRRRGHHIAPEVADVFLAESDRLWAVLEVPSVWDLYVDVEDPDDDPIDLVDVARAFGRFADLKSPYTLGHSSAVAELAAVATADPDAVVRVRVAGLLHDLGVVSVPNGIWDKRGPLNTAEWERVRLHGYHTERILTRAPVLADIAVIAGAHHERLDGSGYHRAINAPMLERDARVIAAADVYQAMRETRAHRAAVSRETAADALAADARAGKLCRRAVDAVLEAAGHVPRAPEHASGLTPREVEVLVEVARGRTNKEIARTLGIALRTTNHHVENIYAKIGVTTRAAAALFAVRHDLLFPA